jgi:hypothetical protein
MAYGSGFLIVAPVPGPPPLRLLSLLLFCMLAACSPQPPPTSQTISGTRVERVAVISRLLSKTVPLPSALLDAHFLEEQSGDGRLGPSDFEAFYALTVAPADLLAWREALSKPAPWNHFTNDSDIRRAAPTQPQPWWVGEDALDSLEFYSPKLLTS